MENISVNILEMLSRLPLQCMTEKITGVLIIELHFVFKKETKYDILEIEWTLWFDRYLLFFNTHSQHLKVLLDDK